MGTSNLPKPPKSYPSKDKADRPMASSVGKKLKHSQEEDMNVLATKLQKRTVTPRSAFLQNKPSRSDSIKSKPKKNENKKTPGY